MCSINHDLKAIFIHIPKTAGTYIANHLEEYYGFKTYLTRRPDHKIFCMSIDRTNRSHENKIHGTLMYYKTSPYINDLMGMNKEKWDSYYKFCFVRNPFDRLVSGWNYVNRYNIPLHAFMNINKKSTDWDYWHVFMNQTRHIINEKGKIGVDFIGKYESLETDFRKILNHLGITKILHNSKNKINSKVHQDYKTYYNSELVERVHLFFQEDFNNFNYDNDINNQISSIIKIDETVKEILENSENSENCYLTNEIVDDENVLSTLRSIGDCGIDEI